MEFWGVEVKAGVPVEVNPFEFDKAIHLSQAALGEAKNKTSEPVVLYLKIDDQKLVLGTLSQDKFPQLSFDLVFEKKFQLSHNWKNGSVHFCGYKAELANEMDDEDMSDSEDEEAIPLMTKDNEKPDIKPEVAKATTSKSKDDKPASSKKQVKVVVPIKDEDDDSTDDGSSDDESDDVDGEDDREVEVMLGGVADSSDDSSEDDDDETPPKKVDNGKKRPNESALKTPVPAKKAKSATPQKTQKTDGKKGGHVATPYPIKKDGKTPKGDQTPKSGGQFTCKSCSKTFNSEGGLQQHSKAKHGGQ